jgi:hypothetical protein
MTPRLAPVAYRCEVNGVPTDSLCLHACRESGVSEHSAMVGELSHGS